MTENPYNPFNSGESSDKSSRSRALGGKFKTLLTLLVVALLLYGAYVMFGGLLGATQVKADSDLYQAVFLSNGEVYFGHVTSNDDDYLVLEDIYYLRVTPALQQSADGSSATNQQQQINLIKLGEELHGPQDRMFIPLQSVVYWENIESDSQVATIISQAEAEAGETNQADPADPAAINQPINNVAPAQPAPAQEAVSEEDAAAE